MEKKKNSVFYKLIWCAMIIVQILVIIFWGNVKEGFFIDELYTLEGAQKSGYYTWLSAEGYKWQTEPNFFDKWHDSDEFIEHITVHEEDWIFSAPFKQSVSRFMDNPYYALVNVVSCINFGHYSKWYAIGLNIVLFFLLQMLLNKFVRKITDSEKDALMVNLLYGFSAGAISTTIFVRMYMLGTLMAVTIAYIHYYLWKNKNNVKKEIISIFLALVAIYLGYRVQEYILVWSAVVCIIYVFALLLSKEWKKVCLYIGVFMLAGMGYLSQNSIASMLSGEQGEAAVENLFHKPIIDTIKDIISYIATIIEQVLGNKYLFIVVFAVAFVYLLMWKRKQIIEVISKKELVGFSAVVSVGLYVLIIGRICPWVSWRYISIIFPVIVLGLYLIIDGVIGRSFDAKKATWAISIYFVFALLLSYNVNSIRELHLGAKEEARILATEYADVDSIFVYDGDEGRLYLNSYIYAPNTKVYMTKEKAFEENDIFTAEMDKPNEILIWVSAVNEEYEETVDYFVEHSSYTQAELLLDRSRHNECYYVYLVK